MELAKGGEVFDKLIEYGSLSEPEAAKLLAQVIPNLIDQYLQVVHEILTINEIENRTKT